MSAPRAYVLSAGDAHHRVRSAYGTIIEACMLPSSRGDFAVEELILRDGTERDIVLTSAELQQMRQAPFSACRTQTVSASCGRAGSTLLLAFHAGRLLASLRPGDRIVVFSDDDALRSELGAHDALRFVSPRFYEEHRAFWQTRARALSTLRIELPAKKVDVEMEAIVEEFVRAVEAPAVETRVTSWSVGDDAESEVIERRRSF